MRAFSCEALMCLFFFAKNNTKLASVASWQVNALSATQSLGQQILAGQGQTPLQWMTLL